MGLGGRADIVVVSDHDRLWPMTWIWSSDF